MMPTVFAHESLDFSEPNFTGHDTHLACDDFELALTLKIV